MRQSICLINICMRKKVKMIDSGGSARPGALSLIPVSVAGGSARPGGATINTPSAIACQRWHTVQATGLPAVRSGR
jgi:hypothetical protein